MDVVEHPDYAQIHITQEVIRHQVYGLKDKEYYFALVDCIHYAVKQALADEWSSQEEEVWSDIALAFKGIIREAASEFL